MFIFLLLILFAYILILLFPNLLLLISLNLIILFIIAKYKKYKLIIIMVVLIAGYFLAPKVYQMPESNQLMTFRVIEQSQNYIIIENKNKQRFISYEIIGPIGTIFESETVFKELSRMNYPGLSEFADYLNNKGVFYEVKFKRIDIISSTKDYRNLIIDYLLVDHPFSKPFLKLILFSDRIGNEEFYNKLKDLSILHLFVISGFHINVLHGFLKKILNRFIKNELIIILLIIPYLYLLDFSIPSLKAFLFILLNILSTKFFNKSIDRLTILTIVGFGLLLLNPSSLKSYSFILSMLASLNLELITKIKIKSKILKNLIISSLMFVGIVPIILFINYEINMLAIIFNLMMSVIIPPIYLLSYSSLIFRFLQVLMIPIIASFEQLTDLIFNYRIMAIFGKPSFVFIAVYYFNYYLLLINFELNNIANVLKLSLIQSLILAFQYYKPYLFPTSLVAFLNVGQGDSILVITPYAKEAILVDTGGSKFFEVSKSRTIPYLKSLGIKKLDYVIITHDDFDHNGSLPYLINNFNVCEVVDGQNFEKVAFMKNLNYGSGYLDDNNRSAVLIFEINKKVFLLTGDIDSSVEKNLNFDDYPKINILKVAHHGSRFSTSKEFLETINPDIAIISVGLNNIYNHPHPSVMERLTSKGVSIFRTDKDGTIVFIFNQFSILNTLINGLKYDIINFGDLYGLFNPWLPKTIS
jgi:competence protein ComEC